MLMYISVHSMVVADVYHDTEAIADCHRAVLHDMHVATASVGLRTMSSRV